MRKRKWRDKHERQHEKWMVHIEHTRPDGTLQIIRRVSPVQTKRGAERFERELRQQLQEQPEKEETNPEPTQETPTLAEFAEEFLAYQATLNKPTELRAKRSIIEHHLIPAFGNQPLDKIDARMIDRYKVGKLAPPKQGRGVKSTRRQPTVGLTPKSINNQLGVLGRLLRVAGKWKLINEVPEIEKLAVRQQAFDFLDFEESELFLTTAKEQLPEWHPLLVIGVRAGLRVGEMLALRWREDIDLERGRLRVQRGYTREGGFDTPKSESSKRDLPLTWDAIEALKKQRRMAKGTLVFPDQHGEVGSLRSVGHFVSKVAKLAGLRHVHPHVLRHTFASHAIMRGVPLKLVQEWMGHATISMTMRYAHLAEGIGDDMIQRLAPRPGGLRAVVADRQQHTDSTWFEPKTKTAR
nr:site-specific integrase [Enhygromyxa salina]